MALVVRKMLSAAQLLMITVTNSRTLIEISRPSSLSLLKSSVCWMALSGKRMCYQNPSATEKPPAPSSELSPIFVANGVRGMRCAIGVSQFIPESGLRLSQKNSISARIVLLMLY